MKQEETTQEVQGFGHGFEENEYRQLGADSESPSKSFPG
jgi:hypothetical protein